MHTILFENKIDNCAYILHGSLSDNDHVYALQNKFASLNVPCHATCLSAHRNTQQVIDLLNKHKHKRIVWVTVAGKSNALSGVISANTTQPCIACPAVQG